MWHIGLCSDRIRQRDFLFIYTVYCWQVSSHLHQWRTKNFSKTVVYWVRRNSGCTWRITKWQTAKHFVAYHLHNFTLGKQLLSKGEIKVINQINTLCKLCIKMKWWTLTKMNFTCYVIHHILKVILWNNYTLLFILYTKSISKNL